MAQDMVVDLVELAVGDTEAEAGREPGQEMTVSVLDCNHFACRRFACGHFANSPGEEDEEELAGRHAAWTPVRPSSVCGAALEEDGEKERKSWSGIDREEGRQRCWRRRHLVDNSPGAGSLQDGEH